MKDVLGDLESIVIPLQLRRDLDGLVEELKNKKIVMLGEASHGTHEYYSIRRALTQRLLGEGGFNFIAVEGDWPDCMRINDYIQGRTSQTAEEVLNEFNRWPTWMWANTEIANLIRWMKEKGLGGFYGLDVYSLFESIDEVLKYSETLNSEVASKIRQRYECFDPFNRNEQSYARSTLGLSPDCEREVMANLTDLFKMRLERRDSGDFDLLNAFQNAKIAVNAERYYRTMFFSSEKSWNLRDQHMMDTLQLLLENVGPKAIVWAHNTHIGDYKATDMKDEGYINLGGIAREQYGEDAVALVGFGSYSGTVLAGRSWGAPAEVMPLPDAPEDSYEALMHQVSMSQGLDMYYFIPKRRESLRSTRGHRAVGVVYNPAYDRFGNYVPTSLSDRYDAFIFIDRTKALKPISVGVDYSELPETWPSGI